MLRTTFNWYWHLAFWIIYIGYAIIYQKIASPEEELFWFYDGQHYLSFIMFFYGVYAASLNLFSLRISGNIKTIYYALIGLLCFCLIQHFKNAILFEKDPGLTDYYLNMIPELFLLGVFASIFSLINYTEQVNRLIINKLITRNDKEVLLNKARINKEILIDFLDNLVEKTHGDESLKELIEFRQLVDFQINKTQKALIPISLEIENLQRYISFYHLRAGNTDIFNLEILGNLTGWQIPHKTILTLVENTIKHGDLTMPVTIDVNSQDSSLEIKVKNRISNQPSLIPSTNIGIDNLKTRFQLYLQNKHRFEIRNENGWYEVVVLVGENLKST